MERKVYEGEIKQLSERGEGTVRIATLNTRDRDGDVLQSGCCGEQTVPLLVAHQWDRVPVGKARVYEQPGAMLADFKINMGLGRGKELYSALRFDLDNLPPPRSEWSFGFRIPEGGAERGMFQGQPVRFLKRFEVLEISPVVAGAGIATATLALKQHGENQATFAAMHERIRTRTLPPVMRSAPGGGACRYQLTAVPPGNPGEGRHQFMKHRFVYQAAKAAAAKLGVACPVVKWFETAFSGDRVDFTSDEPLLGCTWAGEHAIGLNVTQGPEELANTIRHELAHLAGYGEREAEQFARKGAELLGVAPRRSGGFTAEQLVAITQVIRSGLPIPR